MAKKDLKMGDKVHYVTGPILTANATANTHAGITQGGSHSEGKHLLAFVTKDAAKPERDEDPLKADLSIFKHDPDKDLPDFGANVAIAHGVVYDAEGAPNTFHFADDDDAMQKKAAKKA